MSRRVMITGGASGIGAEMAKKFADSGDRVAICDSNPDAIATFSESRSDIAVELADVRDERAMTRFFGRLDDAWGGADVVIANAGTGGPAAPVEEMDFEAWRDCLGVNLDGAFLACRWAAQVMKPSGRGVILITSSTSGQWGHPNRSPYATAKWGLIGLLKTLAMELGPHGIRVNALCPGAVEGERMERVLNLQSAASGKSAEEIREGYVRGTSLRTWVTAEDIAETAYWLASPAAGKISGQAIAIDGHTETNSI
ncbi:MAG: SDR family oxidoreductase [Paracoccaceae bacterium]|nr:SDR family oxidoreductase [Paracoccaceae bacterium]